MTYVWEFGDGETSTDPAPAHTYFAAGKPTVVVTVSNGRQSARSEKTLTIDGMSGKWVNPGTTIEVTQSGRDIIGHASVGNSSGCFISGSVQSNPGGPSLILLTQPPCPPRSPGPLEAPYNYRFNMTIDGQTISGTRTTAIPGGNTIQITLRRPTS